VGYRLRTKDLPGRPDIVLRRRRQAIFVHGCFWHQHSGCRLSKRPSARPDYWLPKLACNQERDLASLAALSALVIWECELASVEALRAKLQDFLRIEGK
jgi:DNA mismatch endonuclease (patch repair protein)